eukprot:3578404-Lingulodinium_polyedra.AAC.1
METATATTAPSSCPSGWESERGRLRRSLAAELENPSGAAELDIAKNERPPGAAPPRSEGHAGLPSAA